ncbi:GNAT family N-acetyltransferase [Jeotgalibacillus sp. R-1-5s-1]|uniref:GNAT family N-acetyltransferase n=1 Tax=Jeotgalibacillus sp. R-1-5s-1 TaxID=2555897 RepID=UPI00106AF59F|nr:GNAT family protein [Jeotgalibacillus sp. R-1-5s-1]TFD93627.1 N-acetyltransferase [Jeotgalibacillus sp. R-1-5s-1]
MSFPELETNRLKLTMMSEEYVDPYFEIMSNDEVTKFYGMDSLKHKDDAEKIISSMKNTYESKRGIRWGMVLKETGEFVGTLGLNNLNIPGKRAEIGYELAPAYWGQGMTSEAVKEVLRYSFYELGLYRVGAVTYPQNEASIQLLKRLGFEQEGLLRGYLYQNEQSHDAVVFSLLEPDFEG